MKRIIGAFVLIFMLVSMLTGCFGLSISRPEIKRGEFDFSVTYEYQGKTDTISGVYVCEFEGMDFVLDGGFCREWRGYIKDGTTEEIITLGTAEDGGIVELDLIFDPDRFMGDYYMEEDEPFKPSVSVRIYDEGLSFECDEEILAEVYGARIISYEYEAPIKNTFG